jgi:predicted metal-dependent hydrolase
MVHLLERNHGDRFTALMGKHLPDWASRRAELQQSVLAAEEWSY